VRDAVLRLFPALRRAGVIADVREHTPGAFIVRLASLQALVEAPRRRAHSVPAIPRDASALPGLDRETQDMLRRLALAALAALGVHNAAEAFVHDEMMRQFSSLAATLPADSTRETALRAVLQRALEEYETDG
jgi:hypothetical protein